MKAIITKYHPATNFKGSRISAKAHGRPGVVISYPDELSGVACFAKAAIELCNKFGWKGTLIAGGNADGKGEVFVFENYAGRKNEDRFEV